MLAVILCGGSGTRLWPVSREAMPKPFMKIGGLSLLQRTALRATALGADECLIVTNTEYTFRTVEELSALGEKAPGKIQLLLEPFGRNTAPAIAAACVFLDAQGKGDEPLIILPADHLIRDENRFAEVAAHAAQLASAGRIVLFGIHPTLPETGFGYIECAAVPAGDQVQAVRRFVEKPTPEKATEYLLAGNFLWNSGMFCFTARTMLAALERHAPDVLSAAHRAVNAGTEPPFEPRRVELDRAAFQAAPDISIDYAVMERETGVAVLSGDFGWSDIGSWKAVAAEFQRDVCGNTTSGDVLLSDCTNVHAQSEDRLIAAVGLTDVVIVDTPDAVLVCDRHASQKIKDVVHELKRRGHDTHKLHRTVSRPWGTYTTLQEGPNFKIKRIEVKPGAALSLQMHHHRSEHWVVVSGTAKVTVAETVVLLEANESTFVPLGARHRLENPTKTPLVLIEVQCGDYVGEDDIVRFDDVYGRAPVATHAADARQSVAPK
jgi:mannose-1-phosphate guanylyltransferase / mannose-6-phosphate isomerase